MNPSWLWLIAVMLIMIPVIYYGTRARLNYAKRILKPQSKKGSNEISDKEYNEEKMNELLDRVGEELKAYKDKSFLEQYGLYMLRVQMYEMYLKQDLTELFNVPEEKADRMNLASILRYYEKNDIRAHPILYANLTEISQQRNTMAHEFLAMAGKMSSIAGETAMHFFYKDLNRWAMDLELAFQQYLMLKETDMLYKDWGVKPTSPYPKYDNLDK